MKSNSVADQLGARRESTKLVIFDLGGVVIRYSEAWYAKELSNETRVPAKKILTLVKSLDPKLDLGELSLERFNDIISKRLGIPKDVVKWGERFYNLSSLDYGVYRIMRKLRKRYKVVILSNISRSRYYQSLKIVKKDSFERYFASCFLKTRKPERKIYLYVLQKMRVKPEEAIFIDNLKENVLGAEAVGIKGLLFTGSGKLEKDLKKLGVGLD